MAARPRPPALDRAVFVGEGAQGLYGIYAADLQSADADRGGDALRLLVDSASSRFGSFPHAPSAAGTTLVFSAAYQAGEGFGLYALDMSRTNGSSSEAWPVATLEGANLTYMYSSYNAFDGACVCFYGSTAVDDAIYQVRVPTAAGPESSVGTS